MTGVRHDRRVQPVQKGRGTAWRRGQWQARRESNKSGVQNGPTAGAARAWTQRELSQGERVDEEESAERGKKPTGLTPKNQTTC